jgi:azurin
VSSATATLMRVACCALLCAVVPAAADARDKGHAHHPPVPAVAAVRPPEAPPPAGYEKVDHEVIIGTVPGQMKFDVELFRVQPGAKVKLVLKNTDEMQHNLLVCRPGESVTLEIAKAAWSLGAQAIDRQFVPDSPLVLHHTAIVNPRESDTLYFTAPREEADYPYVCTLPGHAFTMTGVMRVGKGSKAVQREAVRKALRGREDEWYHVLVTDRPRLVRCVMPDSSARSIAVGLPGGINYCFDAEGA